MRPPVTVTVTVTVLWCCLTGLSGGQPAECEVRQQQQQQPTLSDCHTFSAHSDGRNMCRMKLFPDPPHDISFYLSPYGNRSYEVRLSVNESKIHDVQLNQAQWNKIQLISDTNRYGDITYEHFDVHINNDQMEQQLPFGKVDVDMRGAVWYSTCGTSSIPSLAPPAPTDPTTTTTITCPTCRSHSSNRLSHKYYIIPVVLIVVSVLVVITVTVLGLLLRLKRRFREALNANVTSRTGPDCSTVEFGVDLTSHNLGGDSGHVEEVGVVVPHGTAALGVTWPGHAWAVYHTQNSIYESDDYADEQVRDLGPSRLSGEYEIPIEYIYEEMDGVRMVVSHGGTESDH